MKCTNCGKNEACYHYKYNINGKITEAHLCADCAAKMEGSDEFRELSDTFDSMFTDFDSVFDDAFDDMFADPFFGRTLSPFRSFGIPAIALAVPVREKKREEREEGRNERNDSEVDQELSRKREMNQLREQMKAAADEEDYERAAELRDRLREMENGE